MTSSAETASSSTMHLGRRGERAGDRDALALAAREPQREARRARPRAGRPGRAVRRCARVVRPRSGTARRAARRAGCARRSSAGRSSTAGPGRPRDVLPRCAAARLGAEPSTAAPSRVTCRHRASRAPGRCGRSCSCPSPTPRRCPASRRAERERDVVDGGRRRPSGAAEALDEAAAPRARARRSSGARAVDGARRAARPPAEPAPPGSAAPGVLDGTAARSARCTPARGRAAAPRRVPARRPRPSLHHEDVVGELRHDRQVVADQDDRRAALGAICSSRSSTCACTVTSSAVVGSSAITRRGRGRAPRRSARAGAARPRAASGRCLARSSGEGTPTASSSSITFARRARRRAIRAVAGSRRSRRRPGAAGRARRARPAG